MAKKSIKKNYIYNLIYQICLIIVPLIVTPYISRVLTPNGVGQYSFSFSIISYFTIFASLGFANYAQREIAKFQDDVVAQSKIFWEIMICRLLSVIIALSINFILCFCGIYGKYTPLMYIFSLNILGVGLDIAFVYQGNENFGKLVLRNIIIKAISVALIFIFVKQESDLQLYAWINAGLIVVSNLALFPDLVRVLQRVSIKDIKPFKHLKGTIILFIPTIAISIYTILDKTLIGVLVPGTYTEIVDGVEVVKKISDLENGYYEQSEKIVKMVMTVITCISTVMIPRNSHEISLGNYDKVKQNIYLSSKMVWLLGIPLVLGLCAISVNFVPWFFGSGYEKCIFLIYLLSPIIIIIGFSNIFGLQYLLPSKKDILFTIPVTAGAIINCILNVILIPHFYSFGAAIATVVAEMCVTVIMAVIIHKEINILKLLLSSWKYLICGAVMFCATYFLGNYLKPNIWNTVLLILIGAIIYLAMLIILRDEIFVSFLKKIVSKLKCKKDAKKIKNDTTIIANNESHNDISEQTNIKINLDENANE